MRGVHGVFLKDSVRDILKRDRALVFHVGHKGAEGHVQANISVVEAQWQEQK